MVEPDPEPLTPRCVPRFIYLTGCDGVGKTTQARLLAGRLRESGIPVRSLWLRFPFFFSLPLLAYARWRGFSRYEEDAGDRHGYWDFERSWLLRTVFPWVLLVDTALAAFFHISLPLWRGKTIVCERYVLDILVDLSLALKDLDFHKKKPGSLYLRLLPRIAPILMLDLESSAIRFRRPDLNSDRRLDSRLDAYRKLAADLKIPSITTEVPLHDVHRKIVRSIRVGAQSRNLQGYGKIRHNKIHEMLDFPIVALGSHWTFQGFFCMEWSERWFKLAIDAGISLPAVFLLRLILPWPVALLVSFLIAHTLNFLFNAHLWGVLKHYGFASLPREDFYRYVSGFLARADREPAITGLKVYGSLSRRAWTPFSDLDARIVHAPGARNICRAGWFLLKERSRALLSRFPVDLYLTSASHFNNSFGNVIACEAKQSGPTAWGLLRRFTPRNDSSIIFNIACSQQASPETPIYLSKPFSAEFLERWQPGG